MAHDAIDLARERARARLRTAAQRVDVGHSGFRLLTAAVPAALGALSSLFSREDGSQRDAGRRRGWRSWLGLR